MTTIAQMLDLMPRLKGAGLEYEIQGMKQGYVMLADAKVEYMPWVSGYVPGAALPKRDEYIRKDKGDEVSAWWYAYMRRTMDVVHVICFSVIYSL